MYIIIPDELDYSAIESSIPEGEEPAWNAETSYAKDAVVRVGMELYTSLITGNKGNDPVKTFSGTSAKWAKSGVTNRGAMFDSQVNTQSISEPETPLVVTVPWIRATGFSLLNLSGAMAARVQIAASDGAIVSEKTYDLMEGADNWYDYFTYNFSFKRDLTDLDIGGFLSGKATFTLEGSRPAVGHLAVGTLHEPGATLQGVEAELVNYSTIETNDFGVTSIVERASAKRYDCELYLHPGRADAVFDLFNDVRAKPCVWIGDNRPTDEGGHACLTAFAIYRSASLAFEGPNQNTYKLEILGLI